MTISFSESPGFFSRNLYYGEFNLNLKLNHRKCVTFTIGGRKITMGLIIGHTPKTYYSGNRMYGKYVFMVPDDIKIIKREISGNSNESAFNNNKCLIKLPPSHASCIGFDFYQIQTICASGSDGEVSIETPVKLKGIEFSWFEDMTENVFIMNAMPYNISEIIPNFIYQTSGWTRNSKETHLHAITSIKGISTFIPFASSSEIEDQPFSNDEVYIRYLKKIE